MLHGVRIHERKRILCPVAGSGPHYVRPGRDISAGRINGEKPLEAAQFHPEFLATGIAAQSPRDTDGEIYGSIVTFNDLARERRPALASEGMGEKEQRARSVQIIEPGICRIPALPDHGRAEANLASDALRDQGLAGGLAAEDCRADANGAHRKLAPLQSLHELPPGPCAPSGGQRGQRNRPAEGLGHRPAVTLRIAREVEKPRGGNELWQRLDFPRQIGCGRRLAGLPQERRETPALVPRQWGIRPAE